MPSEGLECLYTSGARRDPPHFFNVTVMMKILGILTPVIALGAMEEAIQLGNGREPIDMDCYLVLCSNMGLTSTNGWEAVPTLRALMRWTRMIVRHWIEGWADTYFVLEVILGMTIIEL